MPHIEFAQSQVRINVEYQNDVNISEELNDFKQLISKNYFGERQIDFKVKLQLQLDHEGISIISNNTDLLIEASSEDDLIYGLYSYLYYLGFRFYLPGDLWTYSPKIYNLQVPPISNMSSNFDSRQFFGTGGLPKGNENEQFRNDWRRWRNRNRFGGIAIAGHSWQNFVKANKKLLLAHPEYLAEINGRRVKYGQNAKFCLSNEKLREEYKKYVRNQLNEAIEKNPQSNQYIISVEPSDGKGHCTCSSCLAMGTVSDRVFGLANEIASDLKTISNKAYVSLYAYNDHAEPIGFALEENVIVQIIPYAYQDFDTDENIIEQWTTKSSHSYIYDYWGIPDWSYNLPLAEEYSLHNLNNRIDYWNNRLEGYNIETSYNKFVTGFLLYLASQKSWSSNYDDRQLLSEFTKNLFPSCSKEIETFLSDLLNDYDCTSFDIAKSTSLLSEALEKKLTEHEKARITEFSNYLFYIYLFKKTEISNSPVDYNNLVKWIDYTQKDNILHFNRLKLLLANRKFKNISKEKYNSDQLINLPLTVDQVLEALKNSTTNIDSQHSEHILSVFPKLNEKRSNEFLRVKGYVNWMFTADKSEMKITLKSINIPRTMSFELENLENNSINQFEQLVTPLGTELTLKTVKGSNYRLSIKNVDWYLIEFPYDILLWVNQLPKNSVLGDIYLPPVDEDIFFISLNDNQKNPEFYTRKSKSLLSIRDIDQLGLKQVVGSNNQEVILKNFRMLNLEFPRIQNFYLNPIEVQIH